MSRLPRKVPSQCPRCGFSQPEPAHLISTYCRSCGEYYEVGAGRTERPALPPLPLAPREPSVEVHCYRCGAGHRASAKARNTLCPQCSAAIDLEDVVFDSPASRAVDTRGRLIIGPHGALSSSWIVCGSASIRGRIVGRMVSTGEVRIGTSEVCSCQMSAPLIVVEKRCHPTFTHPLQTQRLEVFGCLKGIIHCEGTVHVRRGGRLEAEVHARSVTVEKGGALLGDCRVDGRLGTESDHSPSAAWPPPLCAAALHA